MEKRTVNLRDLPEDLVRRAKAHAALSGMTLKDFFVQAVEMAMRNEAPHDAHKAASANKSQKKTKAS